MLKSKILYLIVFFNFVLVLTIFFREMVIEPQVSKNVLCKWEHGENWTYEYSEVFGGTCVEIDFLTLGAKQRAIFNKEIINRYCEKVSFWNLKKWSVKCER